HDRARPLTLQPGVLPPARLCFQGGQVHRVRLHVAALASEPHDLLLVQITLAEREAEAESALRSANLALQQRVELHAVIERTALVGHWTNAENAQDVIWSDGLHEIAGLSREGRLTRTRGRSGIHPDDLPAWVALRERMDGTQLD